MKLVLASNNSRKLRELDAILAPLGWTLVRQGELDIPEAAEPHCTFVENALAKARQAARLSGLPALADDSGLCVDALGGAPGVQSARYAGEPRTDERNNARLLSDLAALPAGTPRSARFVALIVFVRHANDPQPIIAEGEWPGEILAAPRGDDGFGYDPVFFLPELGKTAAELEAAEKNRRSHRGQALARLVERLRSVRR